MEEEDKPTKLGRRVMDDQDKKALGRHIDSASGCTIDNLVESFLLRYERKHGLSKKNVKIVIRDIAERGVRKGGWAVKESEREKLGLPALPAPQTKESSGITGEKSKAEKKSSDRVKAALMEGQTKLSAFLTARQPLLSQTGIAVIGSTTTAGGTATSPISMAASATANTVSSSIPEGSSSGTVNKTKKLRPPPPVTIDGAQEEYKECDLIIESDDEKSNPSIVRWFSSQALPPPQPPVVPACAIDPL